METTAKPNIDVLAAVSQSRKKSQSLQVVKRLFHNKAAVLGLIIALLLILTAIFADVLYDYKDDALKQNIRQRLQGPSIEHPLGTDELGRDVLARIVHGSRISLTVAFSCTILSLVIGGALGAIAGYFGRRVDNIIMRVMDVMLAIPGIMLAIAVIAALGSSIQNLIIALSIAKIPSLARIARGSVLTVRDNDYIEAARAIGARNHSIILRHIIPNAMAPMVVQSTLHIATSILITASLSFLGLGVSAPTPEWGAMLAGGRTFIRDYSYLTFFPGLCIMLSILAFNLLGDGLRDAMDPRLK